MQKALASRLLAAAVVLFLAGGGAKTQAQSVDQSPANGEGRYEVLHNFHGGLDPLDVEGLVIDSSGVLYGESTTGGPISCFNNLCVAVGARFKLDKNGVYSLLPSPVGGDSPVGGSVGPILLDAHGNLLFATTFGGDHGRGGVFRQNPGSGEVTALFSFSDQPVDGAGPITNVIRDAAGNLFGTTAFGGKNPTGVCAIEASTGGCGTVYKLDASTNQETVLHSFDFFQGWQGWGLTQDNAGNLYGAAILGGGTSPQSVTGCKAGDGVDLQVGGCGVIFRIDTSGTYSILHTFLHTPHCPFITCQPPAMPGPEVRGVGPSYLTIAEDGTIFGATQGGGNFGLGVIYKIDPAGTYSVLHHFAGPIDGFNTEALLLKDGKLYGANLEGGNILDCGRLGNGCGTLFVIDTKSGEFRVLHTFSKFEEGAGPTALVFDANGDLLGTTFDGGFGIGNSNICTGGEGCGNVFRFRLHRDDDDGAE